MKQKMLGNSGVSVSEIILGTWVMGGSYWGGAEDRESIDAIRTAWDGGIQTFDTAFIYGNGHSEEVLGTAAVSFPREALTLITKLWKTEMTKKRAVLACENSLKALKSDYIDVYFIHYPADDGTPLAETMEVMMQLKAQGKIRAIGVSNFSLEQIKEAQKYGQVDVIQPCYSLVWRFLDGPEMDYCRQNNIGIIPYSPLAQGILTGKFHPGAAFPSDDGRSRAPLFQAPYLENALNVTDFLRPFAEKYGKTTAQTAIRWLMQVPGITAPIVGGRNEKQVQENLKAAGWSLSPADFQAIDTASKKFTDTLPRFQSFFQAAIKPL